MHDLSWRIDFLREIDRLKSVVRQSPLLDASRRENSAEHSWHLAMYALVLADTASGAIDATRVMTMLLIHDIVEVDAGDTPLHGAGHARQAALEQQAAERIFGLLPEPAGSNFRQLWQEFEAGASEDARFAKALDRFQPLLVNVFAGGGTWTANGVSHRQVLERYGPAIERGAPALWELARSWVDMHFGQPVVVGSVTRTANAGGGDNATELKGGKSS